MKLRRPVWLGALVGAGRAFAEVLKAELDSLQKELSQSSRALLRALALLGVAVVLVGLVLGLLTTALVAYLQSTEALTLWQATLLVAALLTLLAVGLAWWSRNIVRRLDTPSEMVRRRLADHFEWVEGQMRGPGTARRGSREEEEHGG